MSRFWVRSRFWGCFESRKPENEFYETRNLFHGIRISKSAGEYYGTEFARKHSRTFTKVEVFVVFYWTQTFQSIEDIEVL